MAAFDNQADPFQLTNLVDRPEHAGLVREAGCLAPTQAGSRVDAFLPGMEYIRRWGYAVDDKETVIIPPSVCL